MSDSSKPINFEASFAKLEKLVNQIEAGKLSLEDSLHCFEQGVHLARDCQHALKTAEQKVQILTQEKELKEITLEVE